MCGGLVLLAGTSQPSPYIGQLFYHAGRGLAYVFLGAVAGGVGNLALNALTPRLGITVLSCAIIFLLLLLAWKEFFKQSKGEPLVHSIGKSKSVSSLFSKISSHPLILGIITIFLPCGWLYSFVVLALSSSQAILGAKIMLAFWLGTLPILFLAGTLFEKSLRKFSGRFPKGAVAFLIVSLLIAFSMHYMHANHGHHDHNSTHDVDHIQHH